MEIRVRLQKISLIWLAFAGISFVLSGWLGVRYIKIRNTLLAQAEDNARRQTEKAGRELNSFIEILKPITQQFAKELSNTNLSREQILELLKRRKPIEVSGLGVAFLPNEFAEGTKLFAPYHFEVDGQNKMIFVEDFYDYTKEENKWFYRPLKKGAGFTEPYYGKASKTIIAEYSVPIFRVDQHGKKHPIGIVYANQSVEHLNHILDTLFLNHTGYWSIITKKGRFLAHPQEQLVHNQVSIFQLAKNIGNTSLEEAGKKIGNKERVFLEYRNEITGAPSWLFSEPLEGTGWSILGIFDKGELDIQPDVLRRNLIYPSLSMVLFLIMLTLFFFSLFSKNYAAHWWSASAIISFALAMQIVWVWYATYSYPSFDRGDIYFVKNKAELHAYLSKEATPLRYGKKQEAKENLLKADTPEEKEDEHKKDVKKKIEESLIEKAKDALIYGYQDARYVPTGIYVNNLSFIASNQIQMSAYVWQRFTEGLHDHISRGFILPQSTDTNATEISRIKDGKTETILWEVFTKLNQFLNFDNYPFDAKNLRILLWHRYSKKNIVLVPDLDAYQIINPRSLPGVDSDAIIPGWDIIASNFGYKKVNYTTNFGAYSVGPFGIYKSIDKSEVPEMYFEVLLSRKLIDTLVSDLLPIAVIAVLLFVILLSKVVNPFAVIGACASVFFATVFAQVRFRSKIPQATVVYFESFYFLMYTMILLILIVTILQQLEFDIRFIKYRNNMIAKLLYWPLLFSMLAIITLWYLF